MIHTLANLKSTIGNSDSLANRREIEQWLKEGITAAKAGDLQTARFRLLDVVEQHQTNETAWYWLYQIFDRVDDQRTCLENLILLNPSNNWAKAELLKLLESQSHPPTDSQTSKKSARPQKARQKTTTRPSPRPITLKLVTAFWVGISIIFLGSGIITSGIWLTIRLSGRPSSPSAQSIDLLLGLIFTIVGAAGLYVAIMLFFQSMIGFYGSILLALGLLLVGPTVSLITTPPNYVSLICTGGISGMIVLLTLASQSGFENILQDDNVFNPT